MQLTMQRLEQLSLDQIEEFLGASGPLEFEVGDRSQTYAVVEQLLKKHHYRQLSRRYKGLLRRLLCKVSGLSRAQLTRLIGRYLQGEAVAAVPYRRHRFARRYQRADAVLLAEVDQAHGRLSGPATRRILQREWQLYHRDGFERLATISVSHLYNLRRSEPYRRRSRTIDKTRPTAIAIGERRPPRPQGLPGYLRIDTVHQGERDGEKGVYHLNAVDEVTQWEIVGCCERLSEAFLLPVLEDLLAQFPFAIRGFHSDNGSEFVNHRVAGLLNKLLAEFTRSRPRHSNDNALVESKNGAIVRKHMGYEFLPSEAAATINRFYRDWLNPYLNFHRPCAFGRIQARPDHKPRKVYDTYQTPLEKLAALPDVATALLPAHNLERLQAQAQSCSDTEFARRMQQHKAKLLRHCAHLAVRW